MILEEIDKVEDAFLKPTRDKFKRIRKVVAQLATRGVDMTHAKVAVLHSHYVVLSWPNGVAIHAGTGHKGLKIVIPGVPGRRYEEFPDELYRALPAADGKPVLPSHRRNT